MINFLVGKYIIYQPGQYSRPQVIPSLSHNIELRNCPSWNIAHIPRAGAASGLHRPSGCARYFIRDNSFVWYLEITSVIKAFGPSGPHALITGCYFCQIWTFLRLYCCSPFSLLRHSETQIVRPLPVVILSVSPTESVMTNAALASCPP